MRVVRYVILRHEGIERPHFDLMFQKDQGDDGLLTTWRSEVWPIGEATGKVEKLDDHRGTYLDYEGPVSNGRGHVRRVEAGTCQVFPYVAHQWTAKLLEPGPARILFIERSPFEYWVATVKATE